MRNGIEVIERTAADADRKIDPEHFGALIPYCDGEIPDIVRAGILKRRPDVRTEDVVATSLTGLRDMVEQHIEAGGSKFVAIPIVEPADWDEHLAEAAATLLPLQT